MFSFNLFGGQSEEEAKPEEPTPETEAPSTSQEDKGAEIVVDMKDRPPLTAFQLADLAVELEGADNLLETEACERLAQDLLSGELRARGLEKDLHQSVFINRQIQKLYTVKRNIDRMLMVPTKLYDPRLLPKKIDIETKLIGAEAALRDRMKINQFEVVERAMRMEDYAAYKREEKRKEADTDQYHSSPKNIKRLQLRPKWNDRFPYCGTDFNQPPYDLRKNMVKYYYSNTPIEKLNQYKPWHRRSCIYPKDE